MSHAARLVRLGKVEAARELGVVGGLMHEIAEARDGGDPRGALVVAELAGSGSALGRYQAGDYAVGPQGAKGWVRRWTGGHATLYGDGIVSITAILPDACAWLDETGALPGDRIINRYARGVVRGLTLLGLQAAYPGRDFVTAQRKRVAYVSAERDARGVVLFQAIVGVDEPCFAEVDVTAPGLPPLPPATSLSDEVDLEEYGGDLGSRAADELVEGFAGQFRLELEEAKVDGVVAPLAIARPDGADAVQLARSQEAVLPIGVLEAFAALDGKGAFARVCFAGDWIASSAGVDALEKKLIGAKPDAAALRALVNPVISDAAHFFIGLTAPDPVVQSLLSAATAFRARA